MLENDVKKVLFSEEEIRQRCKALGEQITKDYNEMGKVPLLVALLKGSVPFLCELMKYIDLPIEVDFMIVSSYDGTESVGEVHVVKDLSRSIRGTSILIVEDIVDTGRTLHSISNLLLHKGASDVKIVSLLDKPERRVVDVTVDYAGFPCPNEFVIGFGLDFNEKYRNLGYVGVLKEELYK
ncbi:MAG: hypoxanthine phosphoribosyltransferase [Erysipelotrichaceae bacterium]|nr:hypoxanthine phosphoribosyltransferase [Erysipelotrichaceae bacterium]